MRDGLNMLMLDICGEIKFQELGGRGGGLGMSDELCKMTF